jgi:hypothetical protein
MEFYMLGNYMLCNGKLGVCSSADGYAVSHKVDMVKFFDKDIIETILEYSDRIKLLDLTLVEIALLRLIVLTYTGRLVVLSPFFSCKCA